VLFMQQARNLVANEFDAVNELIIDQLHSNVPLVENIGHYIVDAGGKRLRPLLCLLCAGANAAIQKNHITLAAVIEFIHTATLLHDDVVDISELRRGKPTANAAWGNASSVLVGDFLYTRAFQLLVSIGNMPVMELMAETTNAIAEGEVLQLIKAGDPETTEAEYFQVIKNKTAVLFAAACSASTILTGAEQAMVSHFYQYGLHLGYAFQLIDDVLDYRGDPEQMGKNIGDDLAEGKPTLPLIYTMSHGTEQQANQVAKALREKDNSVIQDIIHTVTSSGALEYTHAKAQEHSEKAKAALRLLPDSDYKNALLRLTDQAISRNN
jgi:octaprenyl-diphosphate synthase